MAARNRWWIVVGVALGLACGGVLRARDLGPRLAFTVERMAREGPFTPYRLTASPRGGEALERIAIFVPDWIEVRGPTGARGLAPGTDLVTTLRVDESAGPAEVTVRLTAGGERWYELDLAERSR